MDRIAPIFLILKRKNVSVTFQNINNILLQQTHKTEVKLLVTSDSICIVLHCLVKLTEFNVHRLHTVLHFFFA